MISSIYDAEQYNIRRKEAEYESRIKEIKYGSWKKKWPEKIRWLKIIA
jgi:hypothetical protein